MYSATFHHILCIRRIQRIEGAVNTWIDSASTVTNFQGTAQKTLSSLILLYPFQMSTHKVSWRSCTITGSWNIYTVIHGSILSHLAQLSLMVHSSFLLLLGPTAYFQCQFLLCTVPPSVTFYAIKQYGALKPRTVFGINTLSQSRLEYRQL